MGFFKKPYKIKIFILLTIFIIIFINITSVFAFDVDFDGYTFNPVDLPDWLNDYNFVIHTSKYSNGNFTFYFIISTGPLSVERVSSGSQYYSYIYQSTGNSIGYYSIQVPSGSALNVNNIQVSNFSFSQNSFSMLNPNSTTNPSYTIKFYANNNVTLLGNYSGLEYTIIDNTKYPTIGTSLSDLESLNFDALTVNAWDYSTEDLYLLCYDNNYENTESLYNLYPVKAILLNQQSDYFVESLSSEPDVNSVYWIPKNNIGFNWAIGNKYSFRFAIRQPVESEFSDWAYEYLTEPFIFTISSNVTQQQIEDLNQQTKEFKEEQRHNETIDSINKQTEQDQNFYNTITSNDYNQNQAGDTLNSVSSSASQLDDSNYTGLFSTIFSKLSTIFNSDYNTVSTIEIPFPFSQNTITLRSDIVESRIKNTFLGLFIQLSYMFYFGLYVYRFGYNIVKSAKDGSVLNGIKNQTEVITDSLL